MALDATGEAIATQVARLYFDRGLTKLEIGQRLGISRFRVARILQHARDSGLVRIEYRDVPPRDRQLAQQLEMRYGLDLAVVAADAAERSDAAARLAADVVAELLAPGETVGVAWGSTLAALVQHLPPRRHAALTVVPLAGGSSGLERDRTPAELARRFAERLGGTHLELYAPAFLRSADLRDALFREPEVVGVLQAYRRITTAVVGIGAWTANGDDAGSSLIASGALAGADLERLRSAGAVGELVVHPFDRAGRFLAPELEERAVAIPLARLRAVARVVAVATGAMKATAIRGALASGVVSVLVTDAAAAAGILADAPRARPQATAGR